MCGGDVTFQGQLSLLFPVAGPTDQKIPVELACQRQQSNRWTAFMQSV